MLTSSYKTDVSVKVKCNKNVEEQYFPNKLQNQGKNKLIIKLLSNQSHLARKHYLGELHVSSGCHISQERRTGRSHPPPHRFCL